MSMQTKFFHRYGNGAPNRSFFIADALCFLKSYDCTEIDRAALRVTDAEVAAFHRVVSELNVSHAESRAARNEAIREECARPMPHGC